MERFAHSLGGILKALIAILLFAISAIVVMQVVLRYCFSSSITGANETVTMLFIYMSGIGAAVVIGDRGHIAIPMFVDTLPRGVQWLVDRLGILLVAVLNAAIAIYSIHWIQKTGHFLMPTTGLPRRAVQMSVPLGCGLAVLFCICLLFSRQQVDVNSGSEPE